jgi:ribosomal protein S18 acetylase RimI-like enzyme
MLERLIRFYKKHGFINSLQKLFVWIGRLKHNNQFVFYYCELPNLKKNTTEDKNYIIKKFESKEEMDEELLNRLYQYRYEKEMNIKMEERFKKGATMWCIVFDNQFSGFVWTINQTTIEPYFFPLTPGDIHMFDNEIFEDFRGRGINKFLVNSVLEELKKMGFLKSYIETALWNISEMKSLAKTGFKKLVIVKKKLIFNKTKTIWKVINR